MFFGENMPSNMLNGLNLSAPIHSGVSEPQEVVNLKRSFLDLKMPVGKSDRFELQKNSNKDNPINSQDKFQKTTDEEVKKQCLIRGMLSFFIPGVNDLIEDKNIAKFLILSGASIITGAFSPIISIGVRGYSAITTALSTKKRANEQYEIIETPKEIKQDENIIKQETSEQIEQQPKELKQENEQTLKEDTNQQSEQP